MARCELHTPTGTWRLVEDPRRPGAGGDPDVDTLVFFASAAIRRQDPEVLPAIVRLRSELELPPPARGPGALDPQQLRELEAWVRSAVSLGRLRFEVVESPRGGAGAASAPVERPAPASVAAPPSPPQQELRPRRAPPPPAPAPVAAPPPPAAAQAPEPWKLSVRVTSARRPAVGDRPESWPEGEIEVGASSAAAQHGAPIWTARRALAQGDAGTFELADVRAGADATTLFLWVREARGAWSTRADLEVALAPGDRKTAELRLEPVVATVELFRGARNLPLVPFSTTDLPGTLDAELPAGDHGNAAAAGPPARFTFPPRDAYGDSADANEDPGLFRLRVRLDRVPDVATPAEVTATLKVRTRSDQAVGDRAFGSGSFKAGLAVHAAGMPVKLKRSAPDTWESPYLRVATSTDVVGECELVHSLPPRDPPATPAALAAPPPAAEGAAPPADPCQAAMEAGRQFGRRLVVEGAVGDVPFHHKPTMGGTPFARIPVKFLFASRTPVSAALKTRARGKVHQLNAWWAGQGLEFELVDPQVPIERVAAPARRLITIGEHTGAARVSTSAFQVTVRIRVKLPGKAEQVLPISAAIGGGKTPAEVATLLAGALSWSAPPAHELEPLKLEAKVFAVDGPRIYLELPELGVEKELKRLGASGPADVHIDAVSGDPEVLEIAGLAVDRPDPDPAVHIDLDAPPLEKAFHDAGFSPPAGVMRQWARAMKAVAGDCVAVVVEGEEHEHWKSPNAHPWDPTEPGFNTIRDQGGDLSAVMRGALVSGAGPGIPDPPAAAVWSENESKSTALTLLGFGRWTEACSLFTIFIGSGLQLVAKRDDVQHEMGHALADLDHTLGEPAWFYRSELMRTGSAEPSNALKMTRHRVFAGGVKNDAGTWKAVCRQLDHGYGGAIRARLQEVRPGWVVSAAFPDWS